MSLIRLDKFLCEMGIGSRSEVKKYIKSKKIKIDDVIATSPEQKINPNENIIKYNESIIEYKAFEYYMLNKPAGVVSATEDKFDKTVIELIESKVRKDLFPVGRLDKDTEGLLLITNDGKLAHELLSPKKHVAKTYFAKVLGLITNEHIEMFKIGLDIGEEKNTLPASLKVLVNGEISHIELTIVEGKFHQVKRMFEAIGSKVLYLKRISMGSLILDDSLNIGDYRRLTDEEIMKLKEGVKDV